ncbi:MAG: FHA domain-containing protein [Planctomycetes bacterium]|nr:FHA domain-containing protein [Planctomycetota bacterium]
MAKLVNITSGQAYLLQGQAVVLGRHMACSIRVLEKRVSRKHCLLVATDQGWVLRDGGSRLGTYVNGEFVTGPCLLRPGDRIRIGHTDLVFESSGDVAPGVSLERVKPLAADGLNPADFNVGGTLRRRPVAVLLLGGLGLLVAAAVALLAVALLAPESPARAVRRAAELVNSRRGAELWARLSRGRRGELSVAELQTRLDALPEAAVLALRSLELGRPRATASRAFVPVSILRGGEAFQGEVLLLREGRAWKVHSAPLEWIQRLGPEPPAP